MGSGLDLAPGASLVAVSDVHLGDPACDVELFVDFLHRGLPGDLAVLVLNGDVLDLWRSRGDEALEVSRPALEAIEALRSGGVRVHYVIGNHDFPLLRSLENGPGEDDVDPAALPVDAYHHRYLPVRTDGRLVLIAHGDDIDFRWAAKTVLRAERITERYYDWIASQDRDVVRAWKKEDLRQMFAAWVALRRGAPTPPEGAEPGTEPKGGAALSAVSRLADQLNRIGVVNRSAQNLGGALARVSQRATGLLEQLLRPDVMAVWDRVVQASQWERYSDMSPYPEALSRRSIEAPDHVLCGHLHRPAIVGGPSHGVTVTGAWVTGNPTWRPAAAHIRDGEIALIEHRREGAPVVLGRTRIGWVPSTGDALPEPVPGELDS